jgi:hypothetical protein
MTTYVYAVKVSEDSYEVFNMLHLEGPKAYALTQRIDNAVDSGLPITTMNTTDISGVYPGAVWDGESFSGGEIPERHNETPDWGRYSFLVDNTVFLTTVSPKNSHTDLMNAAAFAQGVIIIKVPEGQTAVRGSIWDGTTFTDPAE